MFWSIDSASWRIFNRFAAALIVAAVTGWWVSAHAQGTPPKTSYKQLSAGLLAKVVFRVEKRDDRPGVEVWSLLVGPGLKTEQAKLPGGAILLVRSGTGSIAFSSQLEELKLGRTIQLEPNTSFQIRNTNDIVPINIRAVIVLR